MKNKTTPWTPEEDAALAAAVLDNVSPARLTVRLHRSQAAIKRRQRELGLTGKRRMIESEMPGSAIEPAILARRFLHACKSGDLQQVMNLYDADATLECACSAQAVYAGIGAIGQYWAPKIAAQHPQAFSLLEADRDGESLRFDDRSYEGKPVRMYLRVNASGKIVSSACAPLRCNSIAA